MTALLKLLYGVIDLQGLSQRFPEFLFFLFCSLRHHLWGVGLWAEKLVGDLSFETRLVSVACGQLLRQVTLRAEVSTAPPSRKTMDQFLEQRYAIKFCVNLG